jgi:hypothetical protein
MLCEIYVWMTLKPDERDTSAWGQNRTIALQQIVGNVIDYKRLLFFLRQRLGDLAGMLDEKLRDRAERTVLQGDDSVWHWGHW